MISNILNTLKWALIGIGLVSFILIIQWRIWYHPTNPEPIEHWCQNKPDGVVMETYHGKVYYDEARPYYYQETCYKKTMKDAVAFSEDTLGWIIRADCHYDPTCFHNIQRIYVK